LVKEGKSLQDFVEEGEHIIGMVILFFVFFCWEICSMVFEIKRDNKWEKQSKQDLEQTTETTKRRIASHQNWTFTNSKQIKRIERRKRIIKL